MCVPAAAIGINRDGRVAANYAAISALMRNSAASYADAIDVANRP